MPRVKIDDFMTSAKRVLADGGHAGNTVFINCIQRFHRVSPERIIRIMQISFFTGPIDARCNQVESATIPGALQKMKDAITQLNSIVPPNGANATEV